MQCNTINLTFLIHIPFDSLSGYLRTENYLYWEIRDPCLKNQRWTLQTTINFCSESQERKRSASSFTNISCHLGCGMISTNYRGIPHLGILVKSGRLNLGLSMNSAAFEDLAASLQCCSPGNVEKVTPHLSPSLLFFCFICSYLSFYLDFLLFHFCCKTQLLCWLQSGKILMMTQSERSDTKGSSGKGRVGHRSWMSDNTH